MPTVIVFPTVEVSVGLLHSTAFRSVWRACPWLGLPLALVLLFASSSAAVEPAKQLEQALRDYRQRLEQLAQEARRAGEERLADQLVRWVPRLPEQLQVVYLLEEQSIHGGNAPRPKAQGASHSSPAETNLRARFRQLRREQAERFFQLALQAARSGNVELTFRCLNHAARDDPDHPGLRRFWGYQRYQDRWVTSLAASRLRRGWLNHPRWGWLPAAHLERYQQGQRPVRGRWLPVREAQRLHSDPSTPWRVETAHFVVESTATLEQAVALSRRLERLYHVWQVLFAAYAFPPSRVKSALAASRSLHRPRRKFRVVYFATEEQYRRALRQYLPAEVRTLGFYLAPQRRSFFFVPEDPDDPTLFHELTHQFCNETRPVSRQVGQRANFWIVEGVACYMESLQLHDTYALVGGVDAERLQDARHYLVHDRFYLPLEQLCGLGMQQLQHHRQITKLYAQSAAWTHLLMHAQQGRFRPVLMQYLGQVFRGRDDAGTLRRLLGRSWQELDAQYRQFMQLEDADLAALAKPERVEYLILCGTRITDAGLARLPSMPRLAWLDLSGTAVTDRGLEHLRRWPELRRLDLSHTQVTDQGLEHVARLPKLEKLQLEGTRVSARGVARLRARLPRLEITGVADSVEK